MGMLPVAPRSSRLLSPGERKLNGFMENPVEVGFIRSDMTNMATLMYMIFLMS